MFNETMTWRNLSVTSLFLLAACAGGKNSACEDACPTATATALATCETAYKACAGVATCEQALVDSTALTCDELSDPSTDTEDGNGDVDTAPQVQYLRPTTVLMLASFGYDSATGNAISFGYGADQVPSSLGFILANDAWNFTIADDANFCVVEFAAGADDAIASFDVSAIPGALFGYDKPSDTAAGDCNNKLNPLDWPDIGAELGALEWGLTIDTAIDPEYRQLLVDNGVTEADLAELIGASLTGSLADQIDPSGALAGGLTSASVVDENFSVQFGDDQFPLPMQNTEMIVGGELQNGSYSIQFVLPFSIFEQLL